MSVIKRSIIGLSLIIGLIIQVPSVFALYSSTISEKVNLIRQDVMTARQLNGVGTLLDAKEKVLAEDTERRKEYLATGIPAKASLAFARVIGDVVAGLTIKLPYSALDPLFMIFNLLPSSDWEPISVCLRNDIWYLEDMRDLVGQEMVKAYLLFDEVNGDKLSDDYEYLKTQVKLLKKYGNHPEQPMAIDGIGMTSSEYFFGAPSTLNSYIDSFPSEERKTQIQNAEHCKDVCKVVTCGPLMDEDDCEDRCEDDCAIGTEITWSGCPEGEFLPAFEQVINSAKNLKVAFTASNVDWGSIWEMAGARARRRAQEWIRANQITLTIGGEKGGNPISLLKGGGFSRFVGEFNTQMQIMKNMVGPLVPLFSWDIYDVGKEEGDTVSYGCMYFYQDDGKYRACTPNQLLDYKDCQDDREAAVKSGINCDKFANPKQMTTGLAIIKDQQNKAEEYQKTMDRAETAFTYNMELNSVGENNIILMDEVLSDINNIIMATNEEIGNDENTGLPTLYNKMNTAYKRQCENKE
jgi:hypothetical protein